MRHLCYWVLGLSIIGIVGCGACPKVEDDRTAFKAAQYSDAKATGPHMRLEISQTIIDEAIESVTRKIPSVKFKLPGLGNLGQFVDRLKFNPSNLHLEFDRSTSAKVRLDLDIQYGSKKLFGERLSDLISDLLHISRIESGHYEIRPATILVRDVINAAVTALEQFAEEKNTTIEIEVEDSLEVRADYLALEHVVINLVQNAVRYTQDGGHVEIEVRSSEKHVRLEVRDNGPGIPEEHQARVFERFYRVDAGRSKHMGGTGLGLSIVKHLVANMNGDVGLEPNEPRGAKFWVQLPRSEKKF